MPKLIIMVGLQGSGKSFYANHLALENKVVLSSDAIRKELLGDENDQTNNELVFDTLYKRGREHLRNGDNVVIDATNITIKDRRRVLSNFQGIQAERIAVVMVLPFEYCVSNDKARDRTVGEEVIKKYLMKFEIPMTYEGFDKIELIKGHIQYNTPNLRYKMNGFDQHNPHHKFDLQTHCDKCRQLCHVFIHNKDFDNDLLIAAEWHDVGKLYTQTFDESGVAHYYGHHNAGAYVMLCSNITDNIDSLLRIVFYINFHMLPFLWNNERIKEKTKQLWGDKFFKNIMILHECDKMASGTRQIINNEKEIKE